MWAVVALVSTSVVAALSIVRFGGGAPPQREIPWDLAENARKTVSIASALATFNITGVVLLLSFAREPGEIGTPLSSAVGMFLVAFISLVMAGLMYANLTKAGVIWCGVDVQTMQYALTTMLFFRSVFLGWLALQPLIDAYGFDDLADQIGWVLLGSAVVGGLTLSVAVLYRLALVSARVVVLVPLFAVVGCSVVALVFELWLEDSRTAASPLYLAYALFVLNGLSFLSYAVLPAALEHPRLGPIIGRAWGIGLAVVGVVSAITIGCIWLATMGLL
jgi:hypothetical protein